MSTGATELYNNIHQLTGTPYQSVAHNSRVIDPMVLRIGRKRGLRLPSATEPTEPWFFGGYVMPPDPGLHENVTYPDLSSLYPNIIRTLNISPETHIGDQQDFEESEYDESEVVRGFVDYRDVKRIPESESWRQYTDGEYKAVGYEGESDDEWSDDPNYDYIYFVHPDVQQGLLADVVDEIMQINARYKGTDMYAASKRVRNSVWGYIGLETARLFDVRFGECITLSSRKVIQYTAEKFTENVQRDSDDKEPYLVMGDTDSCATAFPGVETRGEVLDRSMQAADWLNETKYDEFARDMFNCEDHYLELEIERFADRLYAHNTKKRYVEHDTWDEGDDVDEIVIKGFECIRSDQADVTIEAQREVLTMIVSNETDVAKDLVYDYVKDVCEQIKTGTWPMEELGKRSGFSKDPTEYGTVDRTPQPIRRGAKYANQNLGENIGEGDKPLKFPIEQLTDSSLPKTYSADTKEDGTLVDYIAVTDPSLLDGKVELDYETIIEKYVEGPIAPIMDVLGWSFNDARSGLYQQDIDDYW